MRTRRPFTEINVTPFVDVMLVLLIIFMVTAPLMTVGVQVDLPEISETPTINEPEEPLVISLRKDRKLFIQETETTFENLIPQLKAILGTNKTLRIFMRGDQDLPYGLIMKTMSALNDAGFTKITLLAKNPDET